MTTIDIVLWGFFINLVALPYLAVRYDLLKVHTTLKAAVLDSAVFTRKVNEFLILNIIFSAAWVFVDSWLLLHGCYRLYLKTLTARKIEPVIHSQNPLVPQIQVGDYDITGVSTRRSKNK